MSGAGKLEPVHKVNVSSNITGTLLELKVGIGSKVTKGETLAQIDTSLYRAQAEQQRAQLQAAEAAVIGARANLKYLTDEAERQQEAVRQGRRERSRAREGRIEHETSRSPTCLRPRVARR